MSYETTFGSKKLRAIYHGEDDKDKTVVLSDLKEKVTPDQINKVAEAIGAFTLAPITKINVVTTDIGIQVPDEPAA